MFRRILPFEIAIFYHEPHRNRVNSHQHARRLTPPGTVLLAALLVILLSVPGPGATPAFAGIYRPVGTDVHLDISGNANPDNNFRFDATLNGYIYNLSTKGLSTGTWQLSFTVAGDPIIHVVQFDLK